MSPQQTSLPNVNVGGLLLRLVIVVSAASALVVACKTDYQEGLEDKHYGLPNALAGATQPGPSSDDTADTTGGATGGATSTLGCVKAGGALVDSGTCGVSFKTDIVGAFTAANCGQAGCHGGVSPPSLPRIDPAAQAPSDMWNEFAAFKVSNGKLYINPCSTDPTQAAMAVNVNGAAPPGTGGSLMPLGSTGLGTDVVAKIQTWLTCGSPDN